MRARKATNAAFLLPNHGGDVSPHCSCMHAFCTKKIPSD